jgi:hypothetical protein
MSATAASTSTIRPHATRWRFPMLRRSPSTTATLAILVLGFLSVGCTASVGAPSPPGSAAASALAPTLKAIPTTTSAVPPTDGLPVPSAGSSTATERTATDGPPAASLRVEGGDPVVGQLGSHTWAGGGSDSPWLPGARIRVGVGERLSLALAPALAIGPWTARRAAPGTLDGAGAVSLGEGSGAPIGFAAPGRGTWSVQVTIGFAGGLGSATYYWQLEVR